MRGDAVVVERRAGRRAKVVQKVDRRVVRVVRTRLPAHSCEGGCGRVIRWQLSLCVRCSWRGEPIENFQWPPSHRVRASK